MGNDVTFYSGTRQYRITRAGWRKHRCLPGCESLLRQAATHPSFIRHLREYYEEHFGGLTNRDSDKEVLRLVELLLENGTLACIEEKKFSPSRVLLNRGKPEKTPEPVPSKKPPERTSSPKAVSSSSPETKAVTTWFCLRVVDEIGEIVEGLEIVFSISGRTQRQITDSDGMARIDGVVERESSARLADIKAAQKILRPRWEQIRKGTTPEGPNVTVVPLHRPPTIPLLPERIHTLALTPSVVLARLLGLFFETSKCFLLPCATTGLRGICTLYEEHRDAALLSVGHTDAAGMPDYNDPLSLERADAVAAYLTDDVDTWYPWYGYDKPYEKRWGQREDALMLSALPDRSTCPPGEDPVHWFQRTRGLEADGICGENTRRALIRDYMAIDGTSLPPGIHITTHGCGENFAAMPGEDSQPLDRRVELFFFDGDLLPTPPGKNSPPDSEIYPEWVRRSNRTYTYLPGDTLGTYELLLTDEFGLPFEEIPVSFEVPGGPQTAATDADGRARVVAASGGGTARIEDPDKLVPAFARRLDLSRENLMLPQGDHVHYRVKTRLAQPVSMVDGQPAHMVLVVRTDLVYPVLSTPWQELELSNQAGPWRLQPGSWTRLRMLGDGSGKEVEVVQPLKQEKTNAEWLRTLVDSAHAALFDGDFESVWDLLTRIPLEVTGPEKPPPDLSQEQAEFAEVWTEMEAEGISAGPDTANGPEEPDFESYDEDA